MRRKAGFKMRPLGREYIITAESLSRVDFNRMISLNESAAYLWEAVEGKEFTVDNLAELLMEKYGIDRELAERDSKALASKWIEAGIAEE